MIKLGIVGTDSTHFDCFLQFIHQEQYELAAWYPSSANSRHNLVDTNMLCGLRAVSIEEVIDASDCILI